jgi:hypothetical protein
MAKSPPIHRWRIVHRWAGLTVTIGYVKTPDEQIAIEQAIEKFNIDPRLALKLIAEKTKTQPQRKR